MSLPEREKNSALSIHEVRDAPASAVLLYRKHDLHSARFRNAAGEIHALSVVGDGDRRRQGAAGNRHGIGSSRASRAGGKAVHDSRGAVPIEIGAAGGQPEPTLVPAVLTGAPTFAGADQ